MTQVGKPMSEDSAAAFPNRTVGGVMRLEFASGLSDLHYAAVAIRAWCELSEHHRTSAWKIELAVMEALTNVVVHAYRERAGQPISVVWIERPERLAIEIHDHGEPLESVPGSGLPNAQEEGGRGWPIIRACVDRVTYRSQGGINILTMELDARPG